jgi:hypothetical protein
MRSSLTAARPTMGYRLLWCAQFLLTREGNCLHRGHSVPVDEPIDAILRFEPARPHAHRPRQSMPALRELRLKCDARDRRAMRTRQAVEATGRSAWEDPPLDGRGANISLATDHLASPNEGYGIVPLAIHVTLKAAHPFSVVWKF